MAYLLRPVFVSFALLVWYLTCCCLRRTALDGASGLLDTLGMTRSLLISVRNYTLQLVPVFASGAFAKICLGHVGASPSCGSRLFCFLAWPYCPLFLWYLVPLFACIVLVIVPPFTSCSSTSL